MNRFAVKGKFVETTSHVPTRAGCSLRCRRISLDRGQVAGSRIQA
jgi:hypothetical protein